MSENKLLQRLQAEFPIANLATAFGGVGATMQVEGGAPPIDAGALGPLAERFSGIDLAGITTAAAAVGADGQGVLAGMPDPAGLFAPVARALETANALTSGDAAGLLTRLQQQIAGTVEAHGGRRDLAMFGDAIAPLAGVMGEGPVTALVRLGGGLLPGLDSFAPAQALGRHGRAATQLVTVLGGLLALHGRAEELASVGGEARLRLERADPAEALRALADWAGSDLPERVAAADPDDPAAVEAVGAVAGEYLGAIERAGQALERGVGMNEAALASSPPARIADQATAVSAALAASGTDQLAATVGELRAWVQAPLDQAFGDEAPSLDAVIDQATAFIGQLTGFVNGWDAAGVAAPVRGAIGRLTEVLETVDQTVGTVVGTVRSALGSARDAVAAIDLRRITEAIRAAIQPLADAIAALDALLGEAMGAIVTAVQTLTTAIATAKAAILAAAGGIRDAFDQLGAEIAKVDLAGLLQRLRDGVAAVAGELERFQLEPYFDTAIEVMDTGADALELVPFDILPDDLKAKVDEVAVRIRAIDFDRDVRDALVGQLQAILADLDTEVLATVQGFCDQVLAFLRELDPRGHIAILEQETFEPFLARLAAIDPDALLAPVTEVMDGIKQRIAALDLRGIVLKPVEDAFDAILARFDEYDPAALVQPLVAQVDAVRSQVLSVTRLDEWAGQLDGLAAGVTGALDRVVLAEAIPRLEALYNQMLAGLRGAGGSPIGSIVAMLMGRAMPVRPASWDEVAAWIAGADGGAVVRARMQAALDDLQTLRDALATLAPAAVAAQVAAMHRRLADQVAALPEGSRLRLRLAGAVARAPAERLAPAIAALPRTDAALATAIAALRPLAASGWSEVGAAAGNLRTAFQPLGEIKHRLIAIGRRFGIDATGRDLPAVLGGILAALRPARVLAALQPLLDALKGKVAELVVGGLVAPLKEGVAALRALLDRIDLAPVRDELAALHGGIRAQIDGLRPTAMLGSTLDAFDSLRTHLMAYDPLQAARDAIGAFKAAVAELGAPDSPVRPSVLFAGVLDSYEDILAFADGIDIRTLLQPVLGALDTLVQELDDNLGRAEGSFGRLQGALPGGG